jgi:molybdenum cofactor cytidylyltransferase
VTPNPRVKAPVHSDSNRSVLAVVLAAGSGSRWKAAGGQGHKLLATLADGRPVVRASIDAARGAGVRVCVVSGAADLSLVLPDDPLIEVIHNPDWEAGQASSLLVAVDLARKLGFAAVAVGLGDQPWVTTEAWQVVIDRLMTPGLPIVVPVFDGQRGQPVGLRSAVWDKLPVSGDQGARRLIQEEVQLVEQLVCSLSNNLLADIDTPGDLPWN